MSSYAVLVPVLVSMLSEPATWLYYNWRPHFSCECLLPASLRDAREIKKGASIEALLLR